MIPRITALEHPPTVGKRYLVPTIWTKYRNLLSHWPVFLNLHDDIEFFDFHERHYHVDVRFTGHRQRRKMDMERERFNIDPGWDAVCATMQSTPVAGLRGYIYPGDGHGVHPVEAEIVWKSLRCYRADIKYAFHDYAGVKQSGPPAIKDAWAGKVLPKARTGWVCPHKHFPLGQFAPVDGVITCPMHGLQVHAETGRVLGSCPHSAIRPAGWKPETPLEPDQYALPGIGS